MNSLPYVGQIGIFAGNFAPVGWFPCDGRLLSIAEYEVLFVLIGTTYGGDGVSTFAVPNLQGRSAIHWGQGPGLSNYVIGQFAGTTQVSVITSQLPSHTHAFVSATGTPAASSTAGTTDDPTNAVPALLSGDTLYAATSSGISQGVSTVNTNTVPAGGNQPIDIQSPILAITYCIAWSGIFPSQS